ncbi:MAG: hypothetical protein IPK50_14535 [Fibrobacterota bacterium]|nr:hypothetical protein [Fibrobacterota bacterium]QQS03513.1 MAG: hypothetical protein IPK50_14535 [Fibrobacterota bacterium]
MPEPDHKLYILEPGESPPDFFLSFSKGELSRIIPWAKSPDVQLILPRSDTCLAWKYYWAHLGGSDTQWIRDQIQFDSISIAHRDYKVVVKTGLIWTTTKEYHHWRPVCKN